jgi:PadR family transcriptional regulator AphA
MSLENGILGYLSLKPLTGYDIKKLFNMSAAYFWPADQAQIYRSLKNLLRDGLVVQYEQSETERRKEYSITERGQSTLRDWLMSVTISDFIERSPITLQLFFSGVLNREKQIAFLDKQIELNANFLQKLKDNYQENGSIFASTVALDDTDRRLESATYACRWGILHGEAYGTFLEEIKGEILAKNE